MIGPSLSVVHTLPSFWRKLAPALSSLPNLPDPTAAAGPEDELVQNVERSAGGGSSPFNGHTFPVQPV